MIVQFICNNYSIPNVYRQYEDFYYNDFIKKLIQNGRTLK